MFFFSQRHCRLKHHGDVRVVVGGKNGLPEKIETEDQLSETDYYNTRHEEYFKCVACSYLAKNLNDIELHAEMTHSKQEESELKCCFCPFSTIQKFELYEHLKLHGITEPEDYINKSVQNFSLLEKSQMYVKTYKCKACPYISEDKQLFLSHKQFHRPRSTLFKCKFCSYNVSKMHLLLQHLKIHGVDSSTLNKKNYDTLVFDENELFSLAVETHTLKDVPLVWVSKEGKFCKMYKCRFCPHVNQRKVNIQEHEKMHSEHEDVRSNSKKIEDVSYSCPDCSYVCNNAGVLSAHFKVHQGVNGQIHCIVDATKSDEEQINELTNLLNQDINCTASENEIEDVEISIGCTADEMDSSIEITNVKQENILYFCQNCPARYLHQKELETHSRFHGSRLFYRCDYCSYTARQRPHLLLHYNVHTQNYNNETKQLQNEYISSEDFPPPNISIAEGVNINSDVVWTVVPEQGTNLVKNRASSQSFKVTNKKYACTKCPTKFYNNELLSYHMTLHGGKHPYKCHMCDYSAITRNNLEKHERIHMKDASFEKNSTGADLAKDIYFPKTNSTHSQSGKMNSRLSIKHKSLKNKKYRCLKCPCTFEKREQFKVHLSLHGSKQRYQCDRCDYSVKYYANYMQHVKKHENKTSKEISSLAANDEFNNDMKEIIIDNLEDLSDNSKSPKLAVKSLQVSSEPGALKLSVADRQTFMILQEIRNNNTVKDIAAEDKKLFWCTYCPYTSTRKDAVDNHINRHICVSGIQNNYTCEYCDYTVPQSHFLREHQKIHFSPFKVHLPEGYMISKKMKLSYKKYNEDCSDGKSVEEEVDEDDLFEECCDSDSSEKLYKPIINFSYENDIDSDKTFINPVTHEIIENCVSHSDEHSKQTKEEKSL